MLITFHLRCKEKPSLFAFFRALYPWIEQRRVHCGCVGGQGSLIANRDDGFTFLISSLRKMSSVNAATDSTGHFIEYKEY